MSLCFHNSLVLVDIFHYSVKNDPCSAIRSMYVTPMTGIQCDVGWFRLSSKHSDCEYIVIKCLSNYAAPNLFKNSQVGDLMIRVRRDDLV